jgi:hypothetical protein
MFPVFSRLARLLAGLPAEAAALIKAAHLGSQAARFARVAVFAVSSGVAAHLAVGGDGAVPLAALLTGALETAFRQVWPASPLPTIVKAIEATAPAPADTPAPASTPSLK